MVPKDKRREGDGIWLLRNEIKEQKRRGRKGKKIYVGLDVKRLHQPKVILFQGSYTMFLMKTLEEEVGSKKEKNIKRRKLS